MSDNRTVHPYMSDDVETDEVQQLHLMLTKKMEMMKKAKDEGIATELPDTRIGSDEEKSQDKKVETKTKKSQDKKKRQHKKKSQEKVAIAGVEDNKPSEYPQASTLTPNQYPLTNIVALNQYPQTNLPTPNQRPESSSLSPNQYPQPTALPPADRPQGSESCYVITSQSEVPQISNNNRSDTAEKIDVDKSDLDKSKKKKKQSCCGKFCKCLGNVCEFVTDCFDTLAGDSDDGF